ncbi:MAG: family 20 glycosylhydrolase [Mangrovibacterium sp.]
MTKRFLSFLILLMCTYFSWAQSNTLNIIPQPNKLDLSSGSFKIDQEVKIVYLDSTLINEAHNLHDGLEKVGHDLLISDHAQRKIELMLDASIIGKEAYRIHSDMNNYVISASSSTGIFYGIQTFLQLFPIEKKIDELPLVQVEDAPRFEWRGMHLDVSRHFSGVDEIKKLLDQMARLKLNVFHWHLTDDQGWRIEIPQYPRLTTVGSTRDSSLIGHLTRKPYRYKYGKVSGFYTQDQVKEVVAYAAKLHINVMPELEMPGHAQAVLAAYPNLGCFPEDSVKVWTQWGVSENIFCAGKDETYQFLHNVLDEFVKLFPFNYIHVGGDECPTTHWDKCPLCQQKMQETGCKDAHELQSYFIAQMGKYLETKGKNIVGWDEILQGGIPKGATIMSWRGEKGGIKASELGHKTIMTPASTVYLDMQQSIDPEEPLSIGGLVTLEKLYKYDPAPFYLKESVRKNIIGAQANLWREYISTDKHTEYMYFPRVEALSEVLWTQSEKKNFKNFTKRLDEEYARLSNADINFRVPPPEGLSPIQLYTSSEAYIKLSCQSETAKIYYTTDGSEPSTESALYENEFKLPLFGDSIIFKAASFLPNGKRSYTVTSIIKRHLQQAERLRYVEHGVLYKVYKGPFYSYHEVGGTVLYSDTTDWLNIPVNTLGSMQGWEFNGYLKIDAKGVYYFQLWSICGSALYIGDNLVIDNDGFSYDNNQSGQIELEPGYYPFKVKYFNMADGENIRLSFKRPKAKKLSTFSGDNYYIIPSVK